MKLFLQFENLVPGIRRASPLRIQTVYIIRGYEKKGNIVLQPEQSVKFTRL